MELQKAEKKNTRLRIGLSGASGTGKTFGALLMAYGITKDWSKISIIDSENGSSNLYSQLGAFNVLKLEAPYSPENYIKAINTCENASMEVIIIDSITHEWKGRGGCLEIHKNLGGRFQDWKTVSVKHQMFIEAILSSSSHIITTVRRRIDYSLDRDESGKLIVTKLGTKEETRNGFEYELTVNFELINHNHLARPTKDRTGLFKRNNEIVIDYTTGEDLADWCLT